MISRLKGDNKKKTKDQKGQKDPMLQYLEFIGHIE